MSLTLPDCKKFTVSRTGLAVHDDLSFEEWAALAPKLNEASRCIAFLIGDWLIYGDERFAREGGKLHRRIKTGDYKLAVAATGLDRTTLQTYVHVARRVPPELRQEALSWEHHKAVAPLKPDEQQEWLEVVKEKLVSGQPVSTRRLRKSILCGHLLEPEEMEVDTAERGIKNHIPFVNRLCSWWSRMSKARWLERATPEERAALKRDLLPLVRIFEQL